MERKISHHLNHLKLFDNQRRAWLFLSALVIVVVFKIIFGWNNLNEGHMLWIFVSLGLMVSITWWYWTMKLIRDLIEQRREEGEIMMDIVYHIRDVQNEVRKLATRKVDSDK